MPSAPRRPRLSTTKRLQLFEHHGGVCHLCAEPIDGVHDRWEIDHIVCRGLKGVAADTDANMRPAHEGCHADKTKGDRRAIDKAKRCWAKHVGAYRPAHPMPGSRFSAFRKRMDGSVERRTVQ